MSRVGNPFLADFIQLAHKLKQLGFTYYKGKVVIVESVEEQKHDICQAINTLFLIN